MEVLFYYLTVTFIDYHFVNFFLSLAQEYPYVVMTLCLKTAACTGHFLLDVNAG